MSLGVILDVPVRDAPYWQRVHESLGKSLFQQLENGDKGLTGSLIVRAICKYRDDYKFVDTKTAHKNLQAAINGYKPIHNHKTLFRSLILTCMELTSCSNLHNILLLTKETNRVIRLTDRQCFILLANAFFCTFKAREAVVHKYGNYPRINFIRLFAEEKSGSLEDKVKVEKLKCLLAYFDTMVHHTGFPNLPPRYISFERIYSRQTINWASYNNIPLGMLEFSNATIEDSPGELHVDFANKRIGGGTLGKGSVQEEIRFITSPELILAQLFTEEITDNEVVLMSGFETFSKFSGYAKSFKFAGRVCNPFASYKAQGLVKSIVAMDALMFRSENENIQYKNELINRELQKCQVAFTNPKFRSISSGAWGCGAFGGNVELKLVIQWLASSIHKKRLVLHMIDSRTASSLHSLCQEAARFQLSVGRMYSLLSKYSPNGRLSLLEYLKQEVKLVNGNSLTPANVQLNTGTINVSGGTGNLAEQRVSYSNHAPEVNLIQFDPIIHRPPIINQQLYPRLLPIGNINGQGTHTAYPTRQDEGK